MSLQEHDYEAQPGLPESLPGQERIVWQGAPDWKVLAQRTFHVRKVAIYFAILLAWKAATSVRSGEVLASVWTSVSFLGFLAVLSVGVLTLFSWMMARTTLYTITTERLVLRVGVAIPMTINLPFKYLAEANLKLHDDGFGDLAMNLVGNERVSYAVLWPHCDMVHALQARPILRAVPNAQHVAQRFARAIATAQSDVRCGDIESAAEPSGSLIPASN